MNLGNFVIILNIFKIALIIIILLLPATAITALMPLKILNSMVVIQTAVVPVTIKTYLRIIL